MIFCTNLGLRYTNSFKDKRSHLEQKDLSKSVTCSDYNTFTSEK